jgi:hypothetical protein
VDEKALRKMNPAQLLNPKAFAKEKAKAAKAAKRTPNYGMSTVSLFSFTESSSHALIFLPAFISLFLVA